MRPPDGLFGARIGAFSGQSMRWAHQASVKAGLAAIFGPTVVVRRMSRALGA
jgi:hypothetical protein